MRTCLSMGCQETDYETEPHYISNNSTPTEIIARCGCKLIHAERNRFHPSTLSCVYLCSPRRAFLCVWGERESVWKAIMHVLLRASIAAKSHWWIYGLRDCCRRRHHRQQRVGILWISQRGIWFQVVGALCDNGAALARWKKGVICISLNDWWTDAATLQVEFFADISE